MDESEIATLAALEDRHWWYAGRRTLLRDVAGRPSSGRDRALDIGAAAGGNSRVLRELGWRVAAVEPSPVGAATARNRAIPVVRGDAQRLPVRAGVADLAVLLDVIEHLPDDAAAMTEVARVVRPGGRVIVAVPADPALWSAHDEAVGHLRRYTAGSLRAVVVGAGLVVDETWSWNVLLRPLAAAKRRFSRGSDLGPVPAPLNAAFGAALALERRTPALRRRRGVSLVLTAHRPG